MLRFTLRIQSTLPDSCFFLIRIQINRKFQQIFLCRLNSKESMNPSNQIHNLRKVLLFYVNFLHIFAVFMKTWIDWCLLLMGQGAKVIRSTAKHAKYSYEGPLPFCITGFGSTPTPHHCKLMLENPLPAMYRDKTNKVRIGRWSCFFWGGGGAGDDLMIPSQCRLFTYFCWNAIYLFVIRIQRARTVYCLIIVLYCTCIQ